MTGRRPDWGPTVGGKKPGDWKIVPFSERKLKLLAAVEFGFRASMKEAYILQSASGVS